MATSAGSFSLTGCNVELRYDVLNQDQASNTSTVRFYVILNVTNNYISWSSGSAWVHYSGNIGIGTYYSKGSHTLLTRDFNFTHNSDGNLTIRPGYGIITTYVTGQTTATIVLPKINRYAVTNSVSGSDIEGQFSVNYTKYISSYTQKLRISLPNIVELEKIDYNTSGEAFTLSQATIDSLLQRYTTVSSFNLGFAIETWDSAGTSRLSQGNEKIITATIQNADPTFTHTELETDTKVAQLLGTSASTIVKNISKVKMTIVPTALKGSTIRNVKVTHDGNIYTDEATPYEMTIPITASDFIVSVTDSRNNTTTETISKTLIDYEPFKIQELKFERPNATSSNVILNLKATYYQLTVGSTVNAPVVKWKLDDGTETTIPSSAMTIDNTTHTLTISNYTLTNVLSHERSGTFYISLEDIFSTDSNSQVVNKGIPTFEAGEFDFQVNGDLYIADTLGENKVNVSSMLNKMIADYTVTSNQSSITFNNLNIVPGEEYRFRLIGWATAEADIFLRVNGQTTNYYNTGRYDNGTATASGELTQNAGYRPNNAGFYYANHVSTRMSVIDGTISIKYNPEHSIYNPYFTWKTRIGWQNRQMLSDAFGFYAPDTQQITSITFAITSSGVAFKPGTRIQIIKVNNEGFTI